MPAWAGGGPGSSVAPVLAVLASIPSPSSNAIHIGGLQLRAYGLMIALGVVAAVWLADKRLGQLRAASPDDMSHVALVAVPAGVIGARLYHVITDWRRFTDDPLKAFTSGRAVSASGARSASVSCGAIWVARATRHTARSARRCVRPALPWPRHSAGWATGGTRSCSAGRPTCRGR